ncbi:MAG: hypothetical protein LBP37_03150 [Spirochaetaceae bacterium]|jgi:hypothetical protein|nr:hypothetical protein [Spirochaetaceae bacterium]
MMKNNALFAFFISFFCLSSAAFGWDLTFGGGVDYSSYSTKNKSYAGSDFKPDILPLYFTEFKDDFAIAYSYNIGLGFDTIWRNMFECGVSYSFGHINLGMGFFIGESDLTFNALDIGVSGRAGFKLEGLFFANAGLAASQGSNSLAERKRYSVQAGFWLPHILITADFEMRTYTEELSGTLNLYAGRTLVRVKTEIFSKNVPYRLAFTAGWEDLSRRLENGAVLEDVSFKQFFAGMHFFNQPGKTFAWFIEGEVPLNFDDFSDIKVFYRAAMGLIFSYPEH